ncbi:MAG TPA: hypothetical protein DDW20_02730 [Firmicutes bacterium]|nr:hypothetical protein [Bacillota bacterium]
MKELLKKLNNFRLFSLLLALGSAVEVILVVIGLILYQTSGTGEDVVTHEPIIVNAFNNNQIAGMFYFFEATIIIVLAVVTIYKAIPYLFAKQKLNPMISLGYINAAGGVFTLAFVIQIIYLLATETSRYVAGFVIIIVLGILVAIYNGLLVYPNIKCNFYCPEPQKK